MDVEISEDGPDALDQYSKVSIAFESDRVLDVEPAATAADVPRLSERVVAPPFFKDYDGIPGNSPLDWPARFDMRHWGFFTASVNGQCVGGAVIISRASVNPTAAPLDDNAILWDLRVNPVFRRHGVGSKLLVAVETWIRRRGGRRLTVETQNTNAAACRFYARHGFHLESVNRVAYPDFPDETPLVWYKALD